jgi:hypothetical protein
MAHEKEVIEHLSSEITASIQKMGELRSKTNLAIFIGPYVLLGALFFRKDSLPALGQLPPSVWIALVVLFVCFMGIGLLMAKVEQHDWKHCNECRKIINSLHKSGESVEYNLENIIFKEQLIAVYMLAYFLLSVSFGSAIFLISILIV